MYIVAPTPKGVKVYNPSFDVTEHENITAIVTEKGTVELSKTIIEPISKAYASYVEEVAEVYYRTLMINGGREPETIPKEELNLWHYPDQIRR